MIKLLVRLYLVAVMLVASAPAYPDLLVGSGASDSILRFDEVTGTFLGEFVSPLSGGLNNPFGMASGPDGNLYVSSRYSGSVLRYDGVTGSFIDVFVAPGSGGLSEPHGLKFGPDGKFYVVSSHSHSVLRFNEDTGAFIDVFASSGLNFPTDLAFGPDGNLYVSSSLSNQVLRYDGVTGDLIDVFASGGLSNAQGLAFGPVDGNLYVASYSTNAVLRYDGITGAYIDAFVSPGSGGLQYPVDIEFGANGDLYVQSSGSGTLAALRYDGGSGNPVTTFVGSSGGQGYLLFTSTAGEGNWLEIVCDQNRNLSDPFRIYVAAAKVGASTCALTTGLDTYALALSGDAWFPEQRFLDDHADLSFSEMAARLSESWVLTWDVGAGITETTCTIVFGLEDLQEMDFPVMPIVTMPSTGLTIVDPDPNPPTITWTYHGSIEPCLAVTDYVGVSLRGPGDQEYESGDEMPCGTLSWTPPAALGPGEWTVEISNNSTAVREVPVGLTIEGDGWPLGNDDWLSFRTLGVPADAVSGVPDHVTTTERPRLVGNAPNPFNPQTTIAFELPVEQAVSLRVFDVAGRSVKRLVDGEVLEAGRHEAVWNGRDDAGRQCASGTYFYRIGAPGYSKTKRMVLVK